MDPKTDHNPPKSALKPEPDNHAKVSSYNMEHVWTTAFDFDIVALDEYNDVKPPCFWQWRSNDDIGVEVNLSLSLVILTTFSKPDQAFDDDNDFWRTMRMSQYCWPWL